MLEADPFLNYLPSTIAASAVVLSLHTLGLQSWVNFKFNLQFVLL